MTRRLLSFFSNRLIPGASYETEYRLISSFSVEASLKRLLLHCSSNVPYYRRLLRDIGIIDGTLVDLSRFADIPIITKDIIRSHEEELLSTDYRTRRWYRNASGGSTGEPIQLVQDDSYRRWGNCVSHYWYKDILGIDEVNAKKIVLWGSERDLFQGTLGWSSKFINWLNNTTFLNSLKMTEGDMDRYLAAINACKPDLVRGYANSLYELCCYAERKGVTLHSPKAVVSSAEMLTDNMRAQIETVFGTKVYNFYGSRETNNVAGECTKGFMHVFTFHNFVEILDANNRPVREGEEGRIIITNLHNYSMPLIRYEIGDMAVRGPSLVTCGHPLPILERITGRTIDTFLREDGNLVPGEALALAIYEEPWIKQFQLVQEDYRKVRILLVLRDTLDQARQKEIEGKIRFLLGADCEVLWDFVDEIPTTPQGKYRHIRCLIRR